MADDEADIRKFIAERGVTKCPPAPAAVLGESTPGWRRNAERRAEHMKGKRGEKAEKRLHSQLAERWKRENAIVDRSGKVKPSGAPIAPAALAVSGAGSLLSRLPGAALRLR